MNVKSALVWLGLAAVAGGVLFETSYEVQDLEETLGTLNRQIVAEQEAIQILRAEWSFLNDPTRLETLAAAHLKIRPSEARQFMALETVPFRPAPAVPETAPAPAPAPGTGPYVAGLPSIAPMPARHTPAAMAASATAVSAPRPAPKPVARPTASPAPAVAPARSDDMGVLIARLGGTR